MMCLKASCGFRCAPPERASIGTWSWPISSAYSQPRSDLRKIAGDAVLIVESENPGAVLEALSTSAPDVGVTSYGECIEVFKGRWRASGYRASLQDRGAFGLPGSRAHEDGYGIGHHHRAIPTLLPPAWIFASCTMGAFQTTTVFGGGSASTESNSIPITIRRSPPDTLGASSKTGQTCGLPSSG